MTGFGRWFTGRAPWWFRALWLLFWFLVGLVAGSVLAALFTGCSSTPFTSQGVSEALEAAAPLVKELSAGAGASGENGPSPVPSAPVTVVVIFPNIARSIWPFSEVRLGVTSERYVIIVPRSGPGPTGDRTDTQ